MILELNWKTQQNIEVYEAISKMRKTPVIMIYRSNSEAEGGRGEVDAGMYQEIENSQHCSQDATES